jgi:hypothetical protein
VCDWLVAVKVRGILVVSVTCKNKLKTKWKTQDKATTITTRTITTTITIIKRMKIVGTDNRGKKVRIVFCLYQ